MIRLTDDEGCDWEFVDVAQFLELQKKHNINLDTSIIRFRVKVSGKHFNSLAEQVRNAGGQII